MYAHSQVRRTQAGFTLVELLVVMAIMGLLAAVGLQSYLASRNPARDTARTVHASLFQLRSMAMSNTQARRMVLMTVSGQQQLQLQSALRCSETDASKWRNEGTVPVTLRPFGRTVTLSTTGVNGVVVCFTPRGTADVAGRLSITEGTRTFNIDVALGGGLRTSGS